MEILYSLEIVLLQTRRGWTLAQYDRVLMKGDVRTQAGAEGGSPRGGRRTPGATRTGERRVPAGERPCPHLGFDSGPRARGSTSLLLRAARLGNRVTAALCPTRGTCSYHAENGRGRAREGARRSQHSLCGREREWTRDAARHRHGTVTETYLQSQIKQQ